MSPIRITAARTVGRARNLFSTAFAVTGFWVTAALFLLFRLESAEGGAFPLSVEWASCVSFVLPALVALLAMDVWSEERLTGRMDNLLVLAVRERDYVLGKFIGVWTLTMSAVVLFLLASVAVLSFLAPQALEGTGVGAFLLALAALGVQAFMWSAVSVALSAMFRHAAAVACTAFVLTIAIPRGLWAGLLSWSEAGRPAFGGFPLDEHVIDMASGMVPVGTAVSYVVVTVMALFIASKCVAACRLTGKGSFWLRVTTVLTMLLAIAVVVLSVPLLRRMNPTVDIPAVGSVSSFSQRTRSILTESSGSVRITSFLSRNDIRFRPVGRMLRRLQRESESLGGAKIELRFVDPQWDIGMAERLVRQGVSDASLVFEKGRRMVTLQLKDGYGERLCASAIRRIASTLQRRNVYWTVGHGECAYDAYDAFGMSDIARELSREGFQNERLDLATAQRIPGDCALILIAGAKDDFSRVEIGRLDAYLREGGRLLVLLGSSTAGGVISLLPSWGLRPQDARIAGARTLSGTDVIVSDFADHPISSPLKGSRIVLEHPVSFVPSAVIGNGSGADSIEFRPVASAESTVVAAAAERGNGIGQDVALRPTRIVAVGDASFAMNGALQSRASANRDFFSNCVSYLSGTEAHGSGEDGSGVFRTGMDRRTRFRAAILLAAVLPLAGFLALALVVVRRRRRR